MATGIGIFSFVICLALSWRTSINPGKIGCLPPIAVMVLTTLAVFVVRPSSSTASVAIPYYSLFSAFGSLGGTILGALARWVTGPKG